MGNDYVRHPEELNKNGMEFLRYTPYRRIMETDSK